MDNFAYLTYNIISNNIKYHKRSRHKMAEFNIVHLSDLHIKGDYLSATLTNLIKHIEQQTRGMKNIILVISGDIVDKGQYMICEKQNCGKKTLYPVAEDFFKQLKSKLEDCKPYDEKIQKPDNQNAECMCASEESLTELKSNSTSDTNSQVNNDGIPETFSEMQKAEYVMVNEENARIQQQEKTADENANPQNNRSTRCPEKVINSDKCWLSRRVIDVQIIPGNHDKDLSQQYVIDVSEGFQKNEFEGDEAQWEFEERYFKDFINFANKVYAIFELPKKVNINGDATPYPPDNSSKYGYCENNNNNCENKTCGLDFSDTGTKTEDETDTNAKRKTEYKRIETTFGVEFIPMPCLSNQIDKANGKKPNPNDRCDNCKDHHPDLTLAFVRMNTALITSGNGEKEKHYLAMGQHQLKVLVNAYQKEYAERIGRHEEILTICIGHHPTSYLKPKEEDIVKEYLLDAEGLNADYYLCGHTHERMISSLSSKGRNVTTLVTGIGWDHRKENPNEAAEGTQKDTHSYSIYTFNEEKNIQISKMFRTNYYGEFKPDDSYYHTPVERELERKSNPLRPDDYPFIQLSSSGNFVNEIFVDRTILAQIEELRACRNQFEKSCDLVLREMLLHNAGEVYKKLQEISGPDELKQNDKSFINSANFMERLGSSITLPLGKQESISSINWNALFSEKIDEFFKDAIKTKNQLNKLQSASNDQLPIRDCLFAQYMEYVCQRFIVSFKDCFADNIIRIVIRRHDNNDEFKLFKKHIYSSGKKEINDSATQNLDPKNTYRWKHKDTGVRLITARAYEADKPRIYTLNKELLDFRPNNWEDFIVIAPKDLGYAYKKGALEELRPALSFVFSVRLDEEITRNNRFDQNKRLFKNLSNKLYLLEYIEIDKALMNLVKKFKDTVGFRYETFIQNCENDKECKNRETCEACESHKIDEN